MTVDVGATDEEIGSEMMFEEKRMSKFGKLFENMFKKLKRIGRR